jgi:phospholipid/cholesterol/gamma-HCH transport system substrate-binding protein
VTQAVPRIAGLAATVLLVALLYLAVAYTLRPPADAFEVTAVMGQAGQGVSNGTDVKARGVIVGEVREVYVRDGGRAEAVLTILPDHPLPAADRIRATVTQKTFLGEKQIELFVDEEIQEPFLQAGDVITIGDDGQPREVQHMFEAFEEVVAAIPAPELGAIVEAFGTFTAQDAEIAGENIDLSERLFEFQARTSAQQLDRFSDLADFAAAVGPRAGDLNRLTATIPDWVSILPDRQPAFRAQMDALSSFSVGFAEFLEVSEDDMSFLLRSGESVGEILDPRMDEIGNIVFGAFRYGYNFGHHGGEIDDGSEHAWFKIIFPLFEDLCWQIQETSEEVATVFGAVSPDECPREEPPGQ